MPSDWVKNDESAEPLPRTTGKRETPVTEKFYLQTILALFRLIREFSLDLTELDAETFRERNEAIAERFDTGEAIKRLAKRFELHKDFVLDYVDREKTYFTDRDAEFKNIIDMLFTGLTEINKENDAFNTRIYEKNVKLEKITELTDIRQLKEGIKSEVSELKQQIQEKQSRDSEHMDELAESIAILKDDLQKAREDSQTDALTGAMNRLAFDTSIRERLERSAIVWKSFGLLMIDVDNFKTVNDQYGHVVGDRVLMALVAKLRKHTKKGDLIARYGGEEFAVVLPFKSYRYSLKVARLLCRSIAKTDYMVDEAQPGTRIRFTVSIGVTTLEPDDTVTSIVERADKALYRAKHLGKNRTVGAEPPATSLIGKLWSRKVPVHAQGSSAL